MREAQVTSSATKWITTALKGKKKGPYVIVRVFGQVVVSVVATDAPTPTADLLACCASFLSFLLSELLMPFVLLLPGETD